MGQCYQERYTIPFDQSDVNGKLKLSSFLPYLLSLSGRHSAQLGRSDKKVFETYGLLWVVTDYVFSIDRLPSFSETIRIETKAVCYDKLSCQRRFIVQDRQENTLLQVEAYFALMDFKQRKLVRIPDGLLAPYEAVQVKKIRRSAVYARLEKAQRATYPIRYTDIDLNGHVNNSVYLDWIQDALGFAFLKHHVPRTIQLHYSKEIMPEKAICSEWLLEGLTSRHQICSEGQVNAQAIINWEVI